MIQGWYASMLHRLSNRRLSNQPFFVTIVNIGR